MPRAKNRDDAKKTKRAKKRGTRGRTMLDDVDELDLGPSPEDLRRFGGETAYCPHCGGEVWDQAEVCPACGAYLAGAPTSRPPRRQAFRRKLLILAALLALVGLILAVLF